MRSILIYILLLSFFFLPHEVIAKEASTIDELVEMYNIMPCAECHRDKYEEWKTSSMGNSIIDPRVLKGMRTFMRLSIDKEEALERKDLSICLSCHIPQIKDATPELILHIGDLILTAVEDNDKEKREKAKNALSNLNLNCLGCHNLRGTGSPADPEAKVIYGPRDLKFNPHEIFGYKTVKSDLLKKSEFCAQCHHCPSGVPWKQCPTIFTSYVDDFIVKKGRKESCQDCHMEGDKLSHKFLGPNNQDFLSSSISLDIDARPTRYIDIYENEKMPLVVLKVTMMNNAGHVMPHG